MTCEANIAQTARLEQMYRDNEQVAPSPDTTMDGNGNALALKDAGMSLGTLCARDWYKGTGHRETWLSKEYPDFDMKAVLTTATTWAPEVTRIPRVAEFAARPIQVVDQFPVGATSQAG